MISSGTNAEEYANNVMAAGMIFAEYGDFIEAVIRRKAKNESQADDLYQGFFLSLVSHPLPPDVRDVKRYLYRAITNDVIDAARRIEKRQNKMRKYADQYNFSINEKPPEDALVEGKEMGKFFDFVRESLTKREAEAITLRFRDDCDLTEIAGKMNIKRRSATRYISVGLKKIRHFLKAEKDG